MYKKFYGLKDNPFAISPDPSFYFPTPRHNEAVANLWYGIEQRKGCVVLTGEVGTGKTLVVRRVMNSLDRTKIKYAYIFNTRISPDDFLFMCLADLGMKPTANQTRGQMLVQLQSFLLEVSRNQSTVALIIDEAHLLTREVLEEVRLLTNLENTKHKLIQVLLVGQPELDALLEQPDLRQLKQRISLRCHLEPLKEQEVSTYIQERLKRARAGAKEKIVFSHAAMEQISRYSRGIPRVINLICENAMIAGYARQVSLVGTEIIQQVVEDFRLENSEAQGPQLLKPGIKEQSATYYVSGAGELPAADAAKAGGGSGVQ